MTGRVARSMVALGVLALAASPVLAGGWGHGGHHQHPHGRGTVVGAGFGFGALAPFWTVPGHLRAWPAYAPYGYGWRYPAYGHSMSPHYVDPLTGYTPASSPPGPDGATLGSGRRRASGEAMSALSCETVVVPGHERTPVSPTGQHLAAWVPTHTLQTCQ